MEWEKDETKQKRGRDWPIFKKSDLINSLVKYNHPENTHVLRKGQYKSMTDPMFYLSGFNCCALGELKQIKWFGCSQTNQAWDQLYSDTSFCKVTEYSCINILIIFSNLVSLENSSLQREYLAEGRQQCDQKRIGQMYIKVAQKWFH